MVVFHVDANSAYLSWTAAAMLEQGYKTDIRTIPAVIAGDPENRHGIILAKSQKAKACGIRTGESLMEAKGKCPNVSIFPADYDLYLLCSDALYRILRQYTPLVQRYSIDECFMDCTGSAQVVENPVKWASHIKGRIEKELGFTVNIGIGQNKLCAKMAGELEKPNKVITLWPHEIKQKLWPLPVRELFMVGQATEKKLHKMNIYTVGELANADRDLLRGVLKSHGALICDYANGIDSEPIFINEDILQKGISNSLTLPFDAEKREELLQELLSLCERVGMRLRQLKKRASLVCVTLKSSSFFSRRHQVQMQGYINTTSEIYRIASQLVDEIWTGEPIRQIGVRVSNFIDEEEVQLSFFDPVDQMGQEELEQAVDKIRTRFGTRSIIRGCFAGSAIDPVQGGINDGNYLTMGGYGHEDRC